MSTAFRMAARSVRSIRSNRCSSPPPGASSRPCPSSNRKPRAWPRPAPPSLVALPPIPMINRRAPASTAARTNSPVPRVVARRGSRRAFGTSQRPEAEAISSTAVRPSPSNPNGAATGSPSGPVTVTSRYDPPVAATSAATVPSPPSAIGTRSISAPESLGSGRATWPRRPGARSGSP